jgi:hypothetical protein
MPLGRWVLHLKLESKLFTIDPNSGELSFNSPPDFETPGDTGDDNIYDVTVQALDSVSGQTDTQDIAVTVEDKTDVLVDFDFGDVTTNGSTIAPNTVLSTQVEANGFTFTVIPEGDPLDYFINHFNGAGELISGIVPTGGDELLTYSGVRIELTAGGTFDFGGFTLLGHVRSDSMSVTSYDAFGDPMGDTFVFDTSAETFISGSTYDGDFHLFDDEVANNDVAYVKITFVTVSGLDSHANFLDDFLFEI